MTRPFDFSQAANKGITILPDVTVPPAPGAYLAVSAVTGGRVQLGFSQTASYTAYVSDTPPVGAQDSALWWDSAGTGLYIRYNDGTSTQWVVAENQNTLLDAAADGQTYGRRNGTWVDLAAAYLPISGGQLTGPLLLVADPTDPVGAATKRYVDNTVFGSVVSFNTRVGAVQLNSADVTAALTFTPYSSANPAGYQTAANVTASLAPYALTTTIPVASTTLPLVDGTATIGSLATWAKADHIHPTDTTRYAASNPAGYITASDVTTSLTAYLPLTGGTLTGALTLTNANVALSNATGAIVSLDAPSAQGRSIYFRTGGSIRWVFQATATAEAGGNVGSDIGLLRYDNAGGYLGTALSVNRATGNVNLVAGGTTVTAAVGTQDTTIASTAFAAGMLGVVANVMANADATLTNAQAGGSVISLHGTMTAQRTFTFPMANPNKSWVIRNSTTGGFNIAVKVSAGGSTIVPPNFAADLWSDGGTGLYPGANLVAASVFRVGDGVRNAIQLTPGAATTDTATIGVSGTATVPLQFTSVVNYTSQITSTAAWGSQIKLGSTGQGGRIDFARGTDGTSAAYLGMDAAAGTVHVTLGNLSGAGITYIDGGAGGGVTLRVSSTARVTITDTAVTMNAALTINASGPTIRAGTGAATGTQPKGSIWLRTDGAAGSTLYVTQGAGVWAAVAGV